MDLVRSVGRIPAKTCLVVLKAVHLLTTRMGRQQSASDHQSGWLGGLKYI